jgi:hypothetical protein
VSVLTKPPPIQWVTASPLWPTASAEKAVMQRPALLRFKGDSFMEDLIALLQKTPDQLTEHVAKPESFRVRPVGADADWDPKKGAPLKLFQPVHGYFYLVAANLVCQVAGLPDHTVNVGRGDKVQFVLRLSDGTTESAWVTQDDGTKAWKPVTSALAVEKGEDLLPLFPVRFPDGDRTRNLFVGLVPTSSRETFQAAPTLASDAASQGEDPRKDEFEARVRRPIEALKAAASSPASLLSQEQEASMFLLLDFADFLKNQQIDILGQTHPNPGDAAYSLYQLLWTTTVDGTTSWLQALIDAWNQRHVINGEQSGTYNPAYNLRASYLDALSLDALKSALDALESAVIQALGDYKPPQVPPEPADLPKLDPSGAAFYVLRCVYRRPTCRPPHADLVSPATVPFALAPFFDADAPTRPIRIPLPQDVSIAGLRKFAKNVAFVTTGDLRKKVGSVNDLNNLLKGQTSDGNGGITLGEICSFSLPIITLCAMIVLIIFIILLNIAFWWMPFFRLCFPIPVKK